MTARKVLIIGGGFVADLYMRSFAEHPDVEIAGVWDRNPQRLHAFADYWKLPKATSLAHLFSRCEGALVLNLTNPREHFAVSKEALESGFDVYSEKPLATEFDDAKRLVELAEARGRILASAPCNFLGQSGQMAIAALKAGLIGKPLLCYAELDDDYIPAAPYRKWYSESGAPWPYEDEFEVGCTLEHAGYYLTWLMAAFGRIETIVSASATLIDDKPVGPAGSAPDYASATLYFAAGPVVRLTCSIIAPHDHHFRVFGPDGVLSVKDCWRNDAAVEIRRRHVIRRRLVNSPVTEKVKPAGETHPMVGRKGAAAMNFALGPVEILDARSEGRVPRVNAAFGLHLTEATLAIQNAGRVQGPYRMQSDCPETPLMPWAVMKGASSPPVEKGGQGAITPQARAQVSSGASSSLSKEGRGGAAPASQNTHPLRIGIVGTGRMAARMVEAMSKTQSCVAAGVASASPARAGAFAAAHGLAIHGDLEALLARDDIDAVYIATENARHAGDAIRALEAGKPVLCEKPAALSLEETQAVIDAAQAHKTFYMEGLWTLFLPAHRAFVNAAATHRLGAPLTLAADFGHATPASLWPGLYKDNGVLGDRAVYPVALAVSVFGKAARIVSTIRRDEGGVPTHATLLIEHEGGGVSQLGASFEAEMANAASLASIGGVMRLGPPLLGAETLSVEMKAPMAPAAGGGGLKSKIVNAVKSQPLARKLKRALSGGEDHPFGADQYAPMLDHFGARVRAGASESEIAAHALTLEVQRIIAEAGR